MLSLNDMCNVHMLGVVHIKHIHKVNAFTQHSLPIARFRMCLCVINRTIDQAELTTSQTCVCMLLLKYVNTVLVRVCAFNS